MIIINNQIIIKSIKYDINNSWCIHKYVVSNYVYKYMCKIYSRSSYDCSDKCAEFIKN